MGTRSETVIWDGNSMIVLFKHWDGYPEHMIPIFHEVAKFAVYMAKDQLHWLNYSEEVASFIIAYYGLLAKEERDKRNISLSPDFRPVGIIEDSVNYVYVLDVSKTVKERKWCIRVYDVEYAFWNLPRRKRDSIYRKMVKKGIVPVEYLKLIREEEVKIEMEKVSPILIGA
jgi:hypothetical protein